MKIQGGRARGRSIRAPRGLEVRPTPAKVRAAVFDILGDVGGRRCLDLFCGAGGMGLEALSRGAERVTFIDESGRSLEAVSENLASLGLSGGALLKATLPAGLRRVRGSYDLVFADPPYAEAHLVGLGRALIESELVGDGVVWVHEVAARSQERPPRGWRVDDERAYGGTKLLFLRRVAESVAPA